MILQNIYIKIDPKKIAILKFILEGYDGLATLTTVDRNNGLVKLISPDTSISELWHLLEELSGTYSLKQEKLSNF